MREPFDVGDTRYHFRSALRRGLAAAIAEPPAEGKQRAEISVRLHVERREKGTDTWRPDPIQRPVQLIGPGDIVGLDERMIVRTDPKPDSGNAEPNYFPLIEFADPDFVWRFSPGPAGDKGLGPWITLIVLIAEDRGEHIRREYEQIPRGRNQVPAIKVFSKLESLPDLAHAWRWAHVQVTEGQATDDQQVIDDQRIEALIESHPERVVCRLLCPRRLQPQTLYTAFVVPTFKLGWAAGLGTPAALEEAKDCEATDPSWKLDEDEAIELPYYYRWDFRTSVRGDFEYLVRLLNPKKLTRLGLRPIDCERPGYGLTVSRTGLDDDDPAKHYLDMEGALQSLNTKYTWWGKDRGKTQKAKPLDLDSSPGVPGSERLPRRMDAEWLPWHDGLDVLDDAASTWIPEPEPFQRQLAEGLLSRANADQALVELPEGFYSSTSIQSFALQVLEDGKSVRFDWTTTDDTTGRVEWGPEKADGSFSYINTRSSDSLAATHSATVMLVPERTYHFRLAITDEVRSTDHTADAVIRIPLPAVVPPIYGRWHAARRNVFADKDHNGWIDVLNLDPRHRAAAGLGAKIVRKQQEALMASAWEQIGAIEAANDVLRWAQMGREASIFIRERFDKMALEDFLRITAPVHKRITRDDGIRVKTVAWELDVRTRIPAAVLSPAFRRIARPRGPIRKRQYRNRQGPRQMDILHRLASDQIDYLGKQRRPEGTPNLCEITERMYQAALVEEGERLIQQGEKLIQEGDELIQEGDELIQEGEELIQEVLPNVESFDPTRVEGGGGPVDELSEEDKILVEEGWSKVQDGQGKVQDGQSLVEKGQRLVEEGQRLVEEGEGQSGVPENARRFCDDRITCAQLENDASELEGVEDIEKLTRAICDAFATLLRRSVVTEEKPLRGVDYLEDLRAVIHQALDPCTTITERTKRRLRLNADLAARFEEGAPGDPLDPILAYPEFPQPMYESLRDDSEAHILPGVEKVPQNTVGLLETNGRFLESYMVGLNHEFARELLWRRYPTDQRGSYFRQFWDVSGFIPSGAWTAGLREALKDIRPLHEWDEDSPLGANDNRRENDLGESLVLVIRGDLLKRYPNAVIYAVDASQGEGSVLFSVGRKYEVSLEAGELPEAFRQQFESHGTILSHDLTIETQVEGSKWRITEKDSGRTYIVNRRSEALDVNEAMLVPQLPEFGHPSGTPDTPIFGGSLGADLVFLGFSFSEEDARSSLDEDGTYTNTGKFFVLEERVTETRFGLDSADISLVPLGDPPQGESPEDDQPDFEIEDWDDLHWGYFQLAEPDHAGKYLDVSETTIAGPDDELWDENSGAALRAEITLQKPARLVMHADQMMP